MQHCRARALGYLLSTVALGFSAPAESTAQTAPSRQTEADAYTRYELLAPGSGRRDILLASAIKLAVMPLIAWLFGRFVFGLDHDQLFAAVVLAGLPTAQNIFVYAQRYDRGVTLARDTVLITTIGSVPVLVLAAFLLK